MSTVTCPRHTVADSHLALSQGDEPRGRRAVDRMLKESNCQEVKMGTERQKSGGLREQNSIVEFHAVAW